MNELIWDLKGKAWDYAYDHDTVKGEVVLGDCININFSDAFAEKFAELILTEVVSIIYRSNISDKKQEQLVDELAYKFGLK